MKIRPSTREEWGLLEEMWLRVSLKAHHFIDQSYWISKKTEMEEKYLPLSQTYVCEDEGKIVGFISMVNDLLAALFIEETYQSKGYGYQMVEYVKQDRDTIKLKVFEKNELAYHFYLKQRFVVDQVLIDQETNESEYDMIWRKND